MKKKTLSLFLCFLLLGGGASCSSLSSSSSSSSILRKTERENKEGGTFKVGGKKIVKKVVKERTTISAPTGPSSTSFTSRTSSKRSFAERAKEYGLEGVKATHNYIVDWDGDGRDDLVVLPEYYGPPHFYRFDREKGKFLLAKNPFGKLIRASFMVFADFNRDGLYDILLATLNQKTELNKDPLRLYFALKKKETVVYELQPHIFQDGGVYPVSSLSLLDYNLDGWLDIFIGNWYDLSQKGNHPAPDRLLLAQFDEKKGLFFSDASSRLRGEHDYSREFSLYPHATPTFGSSVCDVDKDGYPDILTASSGGYANRLWLNRGGKKGEGRHFINYGQESGFAHDQEGALASLGGGDTFYSICQDYNNDGLIDIAMGELFHSYDPESRDRSAILTGSSSSFPPHFIRTEYYKDDGSGSWDQGDRRGVWIDLNFDGLTDLLVENSGFPPKSRLIDFEQSPNHSFSDLSSERGIDVLNPSGVSIGDINRDGRADLFVGQVSLRDASIHPRFFLFENKIPWKGRKILKIKLRGKKANYHGIGASVLLKTNRGRYLRNVDYLQGGLSSQNAEGLIFGLKRGEKPLFIEVHWPYLKKVQGGHSSLHKRKYRIRDFKRYKERTLWDF